MQVSLSIIGMGGMVNTLLVVISLLNDVHGCFFLLIIWSDKKYVKDLGCFKLV